MTNAVDQDATQLGAAAKAGVKLAKLIGGALLVYVFALAAYGIYHYGLTRSKLLTYGISDATSGLIATAVLLLAIGLPAFSIVRIVASRGRALDYVAAMALPLVSWGIAQIPANFDAVSGRALKFCAERPDGSMFCLDRAGIDPVTQRPLVAIDGDQAETIFRREKGLVPKRITGSLAEQVFFDPLTGQARVWVLRNEQGCFDVFDNPGVHPQTGERLKPVTKEIVSSILKCERKSREEKAEQARASRTEAPGGVVGQSSNGTESRAAPTQKIESLLREATVVEKSERLEFLSPETLSRSYDRTPYNIARIADGDKETAWKTDSIGPHFVVFKLKRLAYLETAVFANRATGFRGPPDGNNAARRVQLWVTEAQTPDRWVLCGEFELKGASYVKRDNGAWGMENWLPDQSFSIARVRAQFVKIVFLDSHFNSSIYEKYPQYRDYLGVSMGEISLGGYYP